MVLLFFFFLSKILQDFIESKITTVYHLEEFVQENKGSYLSK